MKCTVAAFVGKNKDFGIYLKVMRAWLDRNEPKSMLGYKKPVN